jgi:hypothetical protein
MEILELDMLGHRHRFDPSLHTSIGSILVGFAALILSLHRVDCIPPAAQLPHPQDHSLPQLP